MPKNNDPQMHLVCTKEDLVRLRDEEQHSWANVAQALNLGSPGAARRLYSTLVRPHTESVLDGRTIGTARMTPVHLDGADLEAVRELIDGRTIVVQRRDGTEDIYVAKVISIKGDTINLNDGDKARSVRNSTVIGLR